LKPSVWPSAAAARSVVKGDFTIHAPGLHNLDGDNDGQACETLP
jgi:hypothetical protein